LSNGTFLELMLLPGALLLLWLQLFWSLVPTWRHGEYYAYGWFVPPLAIAFAWRRWQIARDREAGRESVGGGVSTTVGVSLLMVAVLVIPLRMINVSDPEWRPPLLLHAALVVGVTHWVLWRVRGASFSWSLLPVSIFALIAVPPPWQIEQGLVRRLTGTVIGLTHELFLLLGRPVEVSGERLTLGNEVVEVTDGCSGIRSLQSLVMAALFFGELMLLPLIRRLALLLVAAGCAVVVNTGRAWMLANTQFAKGKEAADAAHDLIGHVAFAVSAAMLLVAALVLHRRRGPRRVVVKKRVQGTEPEGSAEPLRANDPRSPFP
jgi:exosortase